MKRLTTLLGFLTWTIAACDRDGPVATEVRPFKATPASWVVEPIGYGVNVNLLDPPNWASVNSGHFYNTFANHPAYLSWLKAAGVTWIRMDLIWRVLADTVTGEPAFGNYEWQRVDYTIRLARDSGFSILGTLTSHRIDPDTSGYPDHNSWANFVSKTVQHVKDLDPSQPMPVRHWAIWNEPNCSKRISFGGYAITGGQYANLVIVASNAIKAIDSQAKIVAGEIEWLVYTYDPSGFGNYCLATKPWIDEMLANAASYIDVVSFHTYRGTAAEVHAYADTARQVMDARGVNKPLWITEVGDYTLFPEPNRQAQLLSDIYRNSNRKWDKAFWWHAFAWSDGDRTGLIIPGDTGTVRMVGQTKLRDYTTLSITSSYYAYLCAAIYNADRLCLHPSVGISGSTAVYPYNINYWSPSISGGIGPFTYEWKIDGVVWSTASTLVYGNEGSPFSISLRVTDALGHAAENSIDVSIWW